PAHLARPPGVRRPQAPLRGVRGEPPLPVLAGLTAVDLTPPAGMRQVDACPPPQPTPHPRTHAMPSRDDALALLHDWVENDGLRKHMLSVEAAMRHYAGLLGQDAELWGMAGLLHDLDWEKYPDEHPRRALAHLRELGYPDEVLGAIEAHAPNRTGRAPESLMERTLFACDEL